MEILDDQPANCNYEFFWTCRTSNYIIITAAKTKHKPLLNYIKKYTSCGNRRYKTKTNLHEKKTAYVRKI
jgi:hypothetical protein